ncbi:MULTISPECIES: hypothetical protein [Halobacterium]|uniref:hypothetical protein n=1 Tax=Halobacterium TaxID=2239 RepID=UPI0019654C42|nr:MULTISPECIES: hypothetical protein [unclassified Halobacterium]QRY21760.1 hypothetical protein JT689_01475 [Halobacterium sp. GSL-19]QRY26379.1 hypothetical protein JRZ79_13090 [Halobacterium sp. BOL4-2]
MTLSESAVRDAAPAAKLVFLTLQVADEPLAQHEIVSRTAMSQRYTRRRLDELVDMGVVEVAPDYHGDLRKTKYRPTPDELPEL